MKSIYSTLFFVGLFITICGAGRTFAQADATSSANSAPPAAIQDTKAVKAADRALRKTVIRVLSRTRGLDVGGINVVSSDGIVTLLGTVPDTRQIGLAADVTRDLAGVREVCNSLTLQANANGR